MFICLQEMDNGLTHPVLNNITLFVSIDSLKMVLTMGLYNFYLLSMRYVHSLMGEK